MLLFVWHSYLDLDLEGLKASPKNEISKQRFRAVDTPILDFQVPNPGLAGSVSP